MSAANTTPGGAAILAKYVAARGGAKAWSGVRAMGWTGHIETSDRSAPQLSFLMLFQRPDATRFEIVGRGQHSIRIFDGHRGWRVRPDNELHMDIEDYSAEDLAAAKDSGGIDGPLVDSEAKGIKVEMEGADSVEGHKAWRFRATLPSGQVQRHWIDASSFLELRYDRVSRSSAGQPGLVSVYYRNYRPFEGITLPTTIETRAGNGAAVSQMIIDKVAINPKLDPGSFIGPANEARHGGVIIDTRQPPPGGAVPPGG